MVFSCATTPSEVSCESSDLFHSRATLASSDDFNRRRIVLRCDWLTEFATLGAPGDATTKWADIIMTVDEFTAAFKHVLLGTSDTKSMNRYEFHEPVSTLLLSKIIVKYYREKFSVANFDPRKVRKIFATVADESLDTNNGTERGGTFFTGAQVTEIIDDLVRQTYLIKVLMDKGDFSNALTALQRADSSVYYKWKFANVVEGDVIGIPVQYRDTQYHGDAELTNAPTGFFTLCIEHRIHNGNTIYECEFQERLGHANLTQAEITFKEVADLEDEFKAEQTLLTGTVNHMVTDVGNYDANAFAAAYPDSDTTSLNALIVELLALSGNDSDYEFIKSYVWDSVRNGNVTESDRKTGYEGIRTVINHVRDFCTSYVLKYWEAVAEERTLIRTEAEARLTFGHPRYNPDAVTFLGTGTALTLMTSSVFGLATVDLASVRDTLLPLPVYKFEYVEGQILQQDLEPVNTAAHLSELLPVGEYYCRLHGDKVVVGLKSYRVDATPSYNNENTYRVELVDWNDAAKFPVIRFETSVNNLVGTKTPAHNVTHWSELPVGVYSYETMAGGETVVFLKSVAAPTADDMYRVDQANWANFPNVQPTQ